MLCDGASAAGMNAGVVVTSTLFFCLDGVTMRRGASDATCSSAFTPGPKPCVLCSERGEQSDCQETGKSASCRRSPQSEWAYRNERRYHRRGDERRNDTVSEHLQPRRRGSQPRGSQLRGQFAHVGHGDSVPLSVFRVQARPEVTQIIPLLVQRGPELAGVHSKKTMMMIVVAEFSFSLLEYYSLQRVYWTPRLALTGRPTNG